MEYDPCSTDVLPLAGTGTTLSRNSRLSQTDSYGPFQFLCMLQQHCDLVYKIGLGTGRLNLPQWISPDICLIKNPIPDSHQYQACQRKVRLTKEVSSCDLHVCVMVSADSVLHLPVVQGLMCFQIVILYSRNYWRHMANVFPEGVLLKPPRKQTLQKSVIFICEKTHIST